MAFSDFLSYIQTTFFQENEEDFQDFRASLHAPLGKTLRINTNIISCEDFIAKMTPRGWTLTPTNNLHVYRVDRSDTSTPLGSTPEHLLGEFYIQELAASTSVCVLADHQVDLAPYRILEMAASPGGKTTQLAELFPNSFIVANEFTKTRVRPLIDNIERSRSPNIAVTNLNGIEFKSLPNTFDRVLLDAPCSGEGIGFKAEEWLKYWNIKNIRGIARLQSKLLHAGIDSLAPGGILVYSTCTLNKLENEGVLDSVRATYGENIEILFEKRFWPHIEKTGGFFIAKIQKTSLTPVAKRVLPPHDAISHIHGSDLLHLVSRLEWLGAKASEIEWSTFLRYKDIVLLVRSRIPMTEYFSLAYYIKIGVPIGKYEKRQGFTLNFEYPRYFTSHFLTHALTEIEMVAYTRGLPLSYPGEDQDIILTYADRTVWLAPIRGERIDNVWPRNWLRR